MTFPIEILLDMVSLETLGYKFQSLTWYLHIFNNHLREKWNKKYGILLGDYNIKCCLIKSFIHWMFKHIGKIITIHRLL